MANTSLNSLILTPQTRSRNHYKLDGETSPETAVCSPSFLLDKMQRENMKRTEVAASTEDLKTMKASSFFMLEALSALDWL